MDRIAETKTERVIEALAKLGSLSGPLSFEISIPHNLLPEQSVIGREDLYQHKRGREIIKPQKLRREAPDPAFLEYRKALDNSVAARQSRQPRWPPISNWRFGERRELRAADMPLMSLDDFFIFERLRTLQQIGDRALARRYAIEIKPSQFENQWISCPDFVSDASERELRMLELDELRDLLEGRRGNPPVEKADIETAFRRCSLIKSFTRIQACFAGMSMISSAATVHFFERLLRAMGVGIVIEPPTGMIALVRGQNRYGWQFSRLKKDETLVLACATVTYDEGLRARAYGRGWPRRNQYRRDI